MKRLLVNDMLSALPGHRTFWNDLQEWFQMEFCGGDYATLADQADSEAGDEEIVVCDGGDVLRETSWARLIIRNASYFGPIKASERVPTISILQDIIGEEQRLGRTMQEAVIQSSKAVVFNSEFTRSKYLGGALRLPASRIIPLPVDFTVFEPGNPMGLQQFLGLPDGCVCWIGACREAGHIKGWDIFIQVARLNPDLHFVAVLKDAMPDSFPPNVRCYVRLPQEELVRIIGACRVGLCTSRMESQHLAGIEMGACGLPLVVPPVGVYYQRADMPGRVVATDAGPITYSAAVRLALTQPENDPARIREYWRRAFDKPVIKAAWEKLVEEVER